MIPRFRCMVARMYLCMWSRRMFFGRSFWERSLLEGCHDVTWFRSLSTSHVSTYMYVYNCIYRYVYSIHCILDMYVQLQKPIEGTCHPGIPSFAIGCDVRYLKIIASSMAFDGCHTHRPPRLCLPRAQAIWQSPGKGSEFRLAKPSPKLAYWFGVNHYLLRKMAGTWKSSLWKGTVSSKLLL